MKIIYTIEIYKLNWNLTSITKTNKVKIVSQSITKYYKNHLIFQPHFTKNVKNIYRKINLTKTILQNHKNHLSTYTNLQNYKKSAHKHNTESIFRSHEIIP